jgi:UDP-N-acetylglucosamine pyrophosphorylase
MTCFRILPEWQSIGDPETAVRVDAVGAVTEGGLAVYGNNMMAIVMAGGQGSRLHTFTDKRS